MPDRVQESACILPWISLHLTPSGAVKTCCAQPGGFSHEPTEDFAPVFAKSPQASEVRRQLLRGEEPAMCRECLRTAKVTSNYKTVKDPQWRRYGPEVYAATDPDGATTAPIRFLDIRFSNLCNFACRTCSSFSSSRWEALDRQLGRPVLGFRRWDQNKEVFENFERILPGVEEIYFAGGEPLIIDGHYRILDWLIRHGRTDIKLSYNTNLSVRSYRGVGLLDYWKHFCEVLVHPSIDAIGAAGEYVREGFDWEKTQEHLEYFRPYLCAPQAMVSVYNVFSIPEQVRWFRERYALGTHLVNVVDPACMSITVLSPSVKERVNERYEVFLSENAGILDWRDQAGLRDILRYLGSQDQSTLAPEFKRVNGILDRHHRSSFTDAVPELAGWYDELPVSSVPG